MRQISGKEIQAILIAYAETESIMKTAEITGYSTVKVRKVLITEGLWESDTSIRIGELKEQGFSTEEIATKLFISVKNVQAYLPYERGVYGGDDPSLEARRAIRYRQRMKSAAAMQVVRKAMVDKDTGRAEVTTNDVNSENRNKRPKKHINVIKLHLELDMQYVDGEEREILKTYGLMEHAISRDILVPSDITLHALHYVILRSFGWQNGHLHCFSLPADVFYRLTENRYDTWERLSGVYFRFPSEDFEDIYWDDDYDKGQSIKMWMKKKYTGPYQYKGMSEHYLCCQRDVQEIYQHWRTEVKELSINEVEQRLPDLLSRELLERLPLEQIMYTPACGETEIAELRWYVEQKLARWDIEEIIKQYEQTHYHSEKRKQEYLEQFDVSVLPVTDKLCYRYDYGDGWEVWISSDAYYQRDTNGNWYDQTEEASDIMREILEGVVDTHRPVCVAKDGIELVDDVGGIHGFCEMLRTIYECDITDERQLKERQSMIDWADMMGWSGRRISPKRTL